MLGSRKGGQRKAEEKIETYQEGVVMRKKEVAKAKQAYANDEADLAKLKIDEKMLKDLVNKLREQKERIEKIEEEERLKKEKEEKRMRIEENKSNEEDIKADEIQPSKIDDEHHEDELRYGNDIAANSDDTNQVETETFDSQAMEQRIGDNHDDTSKSSDGDVSKVDEASLNKEQVGSDTTEGLSKEELGRLVASRWTGEVADKKTDGIGNVEEQVEQDTGFANEHNGYASEAEDDKAKYYDDDFEDDHDDEFEDDHSVTDGSYTPEEYDKTEHADTTDVSSPSWLDKVQQTVQNVLQAFNFFKAPVNVSDAAHIRKEYDDNNSKLSKVQSRISTLTEKLKHDFGKDKEFYTFYDQCFENKESKYVYKICPFKQASQVEGYSDTRLGRWEKFEESYRVMLFSNGDKCWNGPNRSLKVRLRCGLKNEISEVDEPSRCEYVAFMFTPSVCLEDKLEELERKLKQMNAQQPQIHDEF
ncbi:hypothetical protein HPP92_014369 [Vanilla planifolia]|uniref:MRH domain-containing protein n=1 Tax=Vanilla planifolia TaxID=51239 RepID=A0A835R020_VANPL|nr:hypothetical protein HPP92_014369 [Vanilla planifolia]